MLAGVGLIVAGEYPAVLSRPRLHGRAFPDLPHRQLVVRSGEVAPVDDLLDALPAETAEHLSDLGGADKVSRGWCHIGIMTCHLTSRQRMPHTSHMTTIKPRPPSKPWRVTWAGGNSEDYRSQRAAYEAVQSITRMLTATVYHWVDGVWVLYEIAEPVKGD